MGVALGVIGAWGAVAVAFLGAEPHHDISLSEFGVHLAELTVDPQGALAIRQVSPDQLVQLQSLF